MWTLPPYIGGALARAVFGSRAGPGAKRAYRCVPNRRKGGTMTEYICKKPCKIADGEYIVGNRIPADKIAPGREKLLIGSGIITVAEAAPEKQEAPAAQKPEAAPAAPIKRKAPAALAKRKATTQAIATLREPGQIEREYLSGIINFGGS